VSGSNWIEQIAGRLEIDSEKNLQSRSGRLPRSEASGEEAEDREVSRPTDLRVRRFQEGDAVSRASLFNENESRVYALCRRMLGAHEDAEDAVQETFLRATRDKTYQGGPFSTWIYRIAINVCRRHHRSRIAREKREREDGEAVFPNRSESPDQAFAAHSREEWVALALDELPSEQREALVLKYLDDLTTEEVAEVLGVPLSTVKGRLRHGRENLRRILERRGLATKP